MDLFTRRRPDGAAWESPSVIERTDQPVGRLTHHRHLAYRRRRRGLPGGRLAEALMRVGCGAVQDRSVTNRRVVISRDGLTSPATFRDVGITG